MANSKTVGNAEKSSGFCAFKLTISTARLIVMFMMKNTSSIAAGIGTTINTTSNRIATGSAADRSSGRMPPDFSAPEFKATATRYAPRLASIM